MNWRPPSDDKYILGRNGELVPCPDLLKWGKWFENGNRTLAIWETPAKCWRNRALRYAWQRQRVPRVYVSTVFLGLDHNFFGRGDPILWETMIFGGVNDFGQWRYDSREAALAGHAEAVFVADKHTLDRHDIFWLQAHHENGAMLRTHRQRKAALRAEWLEEQAEYRRGLN